MAVRALIKRIKKSFVRAYSNYHGLHQIDLCRIDNCDCLCAYCMYSKDHIPGGKR